MKDWDGIILFIFGCVVAIGMIYLVTFGIRKGFKSTPELKDDHNARMEEQQKDHAQDVRRKQRELMRRQKQQMRDMGR